MRCTKGLHVAQCNGAPHNRDPYRTSLRVVKILDVVGHCHTEFNNGGLGFTVEKFGLHSSPERPNPYRLAG